MTEPKRKPGRPRKKRPLTEILKAAGDEVVFDNQGNKVPRSQILASMLWEFTTKGRVEFLGGRILEASARDWKDTAQWIYHHTDGPASKELIIDPAGAEELAGSTVAELEDIIASVLSGSSDVQNDSAEEVAADTSDSEDSVLDVEE